MRFYILLMTLCVASTGSLHASDFDHSHKGWQNLVEQHVRWIDNGVASQVDYSGMRSSVSDLNAYNKLLSNVSTSEFDSWGASEQLAFLINAYNSFTVSLILTEYPKLESIKDIGGWFGSPWKIDFFSLLGKKRTLDEIEHELIRGSGRYDEPRIHVAVVCASIGCPALRPDAYVADELDAQLEDSMQRFLADSSRNSYSGGKLTVSKIFDWYGDDFPNLKTLFAEHAEQLARAPVDRQRIRAGDYTLDFGKYDWALNDRP